MAPTRWAPTSSKWGYNPYKSQLPIYKAIYRGYNPTCNLTGRPILQVPQIVLDGTPSSIEIPKQSLNKSSFKITF